MVRVVGWLVSGLSICLSSRSRSIHVSRSALSFAIHCVGLWKVLLWIGGLLRKNFGTRSRLRGRRLKIEHKQKPGIPDRSVPKIENDQE
jgi:hypothetical protein